MFWFPGTIYEPDLQVKVFRYEFAPALSRVIDRALKAAANTGENFTRRTTAVRVLEWISFFAAISATDSDSTAAFWKGGGKAVATRLWGADFAEKLWTFPKANDWFGGDIGSTDLEDALNSDQQSAWYVLGYLRLLAAFSYMNLQFHNGYASVVSADVPLFTSRKDMIADLDPITSSTPGWALRMPLDVRFPLNGGAYSVYSIGALSSMLRATNSKLRAIEESAKAQAEKDLAPKLVHIDFGEQFLQQYGPGAAAASSGGGVVVLGAAAAALLALKFLK